MTWNTLWKALAFVVVGLLSASAAKDGNVYLEGEAVRARFPEPLPESAVAWRALDDAGRTVARGQIPEDRGAVVAAGTLNIGWYRIEVVDEEGSSLAWTTAAVLAPLEAPVPDDSPIAVDSATAWFEQDDPRGQGALARLASLAGVRWVRDRLRWRDIEPSPGAFPDSETTYDTAAAAQVAAGLEVLQVFHDTPPWATDPALDGERARGRFARDLRTVYRLGREMARRFRGTVRAWEPWNEANIEVFGGHTVDEMCSWQKAAWLGFKAGDPDVIVGWNAYTTAPTRLHAEGVIANEAWPYFDTYNIHTYDWPESYEELWPLAREAACGRPLWVTEADRGLRYSGEKPWCELSRDGELRKAEYMAHAYASSLFAGASRHFHFILGHYTEDHNGVQFGLLRLDRTPRPAYVALAAIGRVLAGARCIGRWKIAERPEARIYAFRARPGGRERDVLVAWCERPGEWETRGDCETEWSLPADLEPLECLDYLGRPLGPRAPARLVAGAVFVLLSPGSVSRLPLEAPPPPAPRREGDASPVVLQVQLPRSSVRRVEERRWAQGHDYAVEAATPVELPFYVYNFADRSVSGEVRIEGLPPGSRLEPDRWEVSVAPMERAKMRATYVAPPAAEPAAPVPWIRLRGDFGSAGRPVLAFRLPSR